MCRKKKKLFDIGVIHPFRYCVTPRARKKHYGCRLVSEFRLGYLRNEGIVELHQ